MQKRNSSKKIYGGIWSVTGGHVLYGENNEDAIIREIKEELNLSIKRENIIFVITYKSKKIKDHVINNKFLSIYNVKINEEDFYKIKIQTKELEDVKLFSIDEIENIMKRKDKKYKFPQYAEILIKQIKEKNN